MEQTKLLINIAGENGYRSALNDFWDEIKVLEKEGNLPNHYNLFAIWKKLLDKKYIALK